MNTLPRAVTALFFPTPDSYNALRRHWSSLINSDRRHALTAAQHLLYLALLGKDWRKAFTCPTNRHKLDNGAFPGWALFRSLEVVRSPWADPALLAPFDGLVTPEMLAALRGCLPSVSAYRLRAEDFAHGAFPFDAYTTESSAALTAIPGDTHA